MASIDPAVSAVLDRNRAAGAEEEDEDELIALLEEDDSSMAAFREQRLQQLHGEFSRAKDMRNSEHGTYTEVKDEKKLMDITTSTKLCVVHFMKPDFTRCRVMDQKLEVRIILSDKNVDRWLTLRSGFGAKAFRHPLPQHQRRKRAFPRCQAKDTGLALRHLLHRWRRY